VVAKDRRHAHIRMDRANSQSGTNDEELQFHFVC